MKASSGIRKIWLRAKNTHHETLKWEKLLRQKLKNLGFEITLKPGAGTQLCLCLGGDGSLLSAIREIKGSGPRKIPKKTQAKNFPILGLHTSPGLGFLPQLNLPKDSQAVGTFIETLATLLQSGHFRVGQRAGLEALSTQEKFWAFNDIVLGKGMLSRMVSLQVEVDGYAVYSNLKGDGLIVSTSTGSTAYSLSAGGPIVHPEVEALILTPICPHDVSQRPLVLPARAKVKIKVLDLKGPCFLTADGQQGRQLKPGETLRISQSSQKVNWLYFLEDSPLVQNYFENLQSKLGLGRS